MRVSGHVASGLLPGFRKTSLLLGLLASATALAEQPPPAERSRADREESIEEIVVVGSLIRRKAVYEGRAPVQVLDRSSFESVGAAQPVDILATLTANTGSTLAAEQNYLQGVSQFSLRGVGLSSTLTLINGRRAGFAPVSNDAGQSFFDINTLPTLAIERVEILRDGASATYGSQAVAGVANIVIRRGFTGVEIEGGYRNASNQAWDLGIAAGLDAPRGRASVFGTLYQQDENFRTDFDWLIPRALDPDGDGDIVEGSFDSGRGSPGSFRRVQHHADGTYAPFQVGGFDAPHSPDPDCRAAGGYPSGQLCRMDFSGQRTMIAAEKRAQFFAQAELDFARAATLVSELGYSKNEVTDRVGNMPLFNGNVEGSNEFFVPANHPFNFFTDPDDDGMLDYIAPSEWNADRHEAVPLGYFGRPLGAEAAGENSGHERREFENLRIMLGTETELPGGWSGEGHLMHASSRLSVNSERHWISAEFARALRQGEWNPFATRLTTPDLVTPKTLSGDGLSEAHVGKRAGNVEEVLRQFEGVRSERAKSTQNVAELVVTSPDLDWWGQAANLALGAQYREITYSFLPDPLNAAGEGPRDVQEFPSKADQSAAAAFAESLIQFGWRAEVQLALRHERYDRAGSTTDPKLAAQFFVNDKVSLRASWGTSFQAPSVFQAGGNTSQRTLTDPFRFDGQGNGRCTLGPSGEIVSRGDNFSIVSLLRGGNLSPQTARSTNLGLLFSPHARSALSLDYWTLDYRDVIAQGRSFQKILDDDCRDDGVPNAAEVLRDSSGQLNAVETDYENIGAVRTEGLDFNAYYNFELPRSELRISGNATLLTRFDVDASGDGFVDRLGNRNDSNGFAPTPELRFSLGVSWQKGAHTASITVRHIDAYRNDEVPAQPEIKAWTTWDVNYSYRASSLLGGEVQFFFGARNLTDKDPPPLPTGREGIHRYNLRPGFDGLVHDIKGRTLYARIRVRLAH